MLNVGYLGNIDVLYFVLLVLVKIIIFLLNLFGFLNRVNMWFKLFFERIIIIILVEIWLIGIMFCCDKYNFLYLILSFVFIVFFNFLIVLEGKYFVVIIVNEIDDDCFFCNIFFENKG